MFKFSVVIVGILVTIVTGKFQPPPDICSGLDVSKEPRLEARQLDGWWFTHRVLSLGFPSNTIFFFQFQDREVWGNDWNAEPQSCTYRKSLDVQRQSVTLGPFSPCVLGRQTLPEEEDTFTEFFYWVPTKDILMFYFCPAEVKSSPCSVDPFIRVLTRSRNITRRQLNLVRRKLRTLGVSLDSLAVVNAKENRCPIPRNTFFRRNKGRYGKRL